MADATVWWLVAGAAVAVELATGTFYLLMLAIGLAAGALAAHAGAATPYQLVVAADSTTTLTVPSNTTEMAALIASAMRMLQSGKPAAA